MKANEQTAGLSTTRLVFGGLGIIGGIWMILAPFALGYNNMTVLDAKTKKLVPVDLGAVTTSDIIVGLLLLGLVGFALATASNPAMAKLRMYANLAVIGVGIYLLAAPYLFDLLKVASYLSLDEPNTNDQLIGLLTIIIAGFTFQKEFLLPETETENVSQLTTSA
jgi:drug/metabolite transporter (DMT)-like permease